jgi:hypothetical protein
MAMAMAKPYLLLFFSAVMKKKNPYLLYSITKPFPLIHHSNSRSQPAHLTNSLSLSLYYYL